MNLGSPSKRSAELYSAGGELASLPAIPIQPSTQQNQHRRERPARHVKNECASTRPLGYVVDMTIFLLFV